MKFSKWLIWGTLILLFVTVIFSLLGLFIGVWLETKNYKALENTEVRIVYPSKSVVTGVIFSSNDSEVEIQLFDPRFSEKVLQKCVLRLTSANGRHYSGYILPSCEFGLKFNEASFFDMEIIDGKISDIISSSENRGYVITINTKGK